MNFSQQRRLTTGWLNIQTVHLSFWYMHSDACATAQLPYQ